MKNIITQEHIRQAFSYASFRDKINHLLIERKTTGPNQSEKLVHFTRMNAKRMDRLDKTTVIKPELLEELRIIKEYQIWVGIVEAWCGDVPHNIAPLAKMSVSVPNLSMKLLLRDEHPDVIDGYLTNGSRSIPKVIALKADTLEELWVWGPRPAPAAQLALEMKEKGEPQEQISEALQKWYNKDKTQTLQQEILKKIRLASS